MIKRTWGSLLQRYPLRKKATWALLLSLLGSIGAQVGIEQITPISDQLQNVLNGVWEVLVISGFIQSSEKAVTPVHDPRDNDGALLVPAARGDWI